MPIVKVITEKQDTTSSNSSQGQNSSSQGDTKTKGKNAFDATTTALFVKGRKVGELDKNLTNTLNMLTKRVNGSAFAVNDVDGINYLLSIKNSKSKIKVSADQNSLSVDLSISLYCQISDQTSTINEGVFVNSDVLPDNVKKATENMITQNVLDLLKTSKQTGCDFLYLKEKLYRFCNKQYSRYKDNYLDAMKVNIKVDIYGQK